MKIAYQNVIWLLFFAAYQYKSLADDGALPVDIVAFFDKENSQAEMVLNASVSNFNSIHGWKVTFKANNYIIKDPDSFENSNFLCNQTAALNVGGVFCPTSEEIAPIVESLCENLEIPAMQMNWRPYQYHQEHFVVNFFPDPRKLFQGLGVIVRNLQWRSIVIFYEMTENFLNLQSILKNQLYETSKKYNSINIIELGPGPDYRSALKQIQNKSELRIVLDCKTENVIEILKQAKELGFLESRFSYFLTSLDAHTLDLKSLNTSANITTVRIMDPESKNFKYVLSRWEQYTLRQIDPYSIKTESALMFDAATMYLKGFKDILETDSALQAKPLSCDESAVKRESKGLLSVASFIKAKTDDPSTVSSSSITGPIAFDRLGRRTSFMIHVVAGWQDNVVATWNPDQPNTLNFIKSEADRYKELEKQWSTGEVVVASILGPPYLMEKNASEGQILTGNDRYEGFSMDLMLALSKELGGIKFVFNVLPKKDRGSYSEKTKSWSGLMKEILDGRADLAICDLTITPERREAVDFSTPFMRLGISILYKKEEEKEANMFAFLDPLSLDLWIYSATIYLAITVVIYFISRMSPRDWENPHPCDQEPEELENIWDMKNCLWLTLGAIMNQGCDILPKGLASRMAASMWWFFAIIVTNSYMANLAAFLTNERTQGSIKNAEDLAKQTKIKYGTLKGGSTESFFKNSNYSVYQRMWTSMQQSKPSVFENDNTDGVARVRNTKNRLYAFLMESSTLEYEIQTKCDLEQVGTWLDSKSYGIAMPLDYPHRSRINEKLLLLQEDGKINELKDKWWKEKRTEPLCPPEPTGGPSNKLALKNVGGVFLVLVVGVALAYLVAICEFLWNVRNVSVEEHISFKQALKVELLFALNVMVTKKRVKPQVSESSSSHSGASRSRSLAHDILHGAGSFLRLDNLSKAGTPGSSRHTSRPLD